MTTYFNRDTVQLNLMLQLVKLMQKFSVGPGVAVGEFDARACSSGTS
jgi:hypothetical protein